MHLGIRCTLFILSFLIVRPAFGQNHMLLRWHYTLNAENQKIIEKADQVYAEIHARLQRYPNEFSITHIDSVQKFLGTSLFKTFIQDIPLHKLLAVRDNFKVQTFVYFDLIPTDAHFYLQMQVVEFPSNVFIKSFQLPVHEKSKVDNIADAFMRQFSTSSPPLLGNPFSQGTGMIYVHTPQNKLFSEHIAIFDAWLKRAEDNLFIKIIKTNPDYQFDEQAFFTCNADILLDMTQADSAYLYQKLDSLPQHLDITLPLWPTEFFKKLSVLPNPQFPDYLLKAWFPNILLLRSQELYSALLQQNAAAVSIAALYNLTPFLDSASDARIRNMQHHYKQLFDYFIDDPIKLGWITLNAAALNQKLNDPELALAGYKSAELAFMESGDSYMQLFATLQQADIFKNMQDHHSAVNTLQSSLALAKQHNELQVSARIQENLGNLFKDMERPLDAWLAWEAAIQDYSQQNPKKAIPLCLKTAQLLDQPEYGTHAEQFYQKGLDLAIAVDDLNAQAEFRKQLGFFYKSRNTDKAQLQFRQAIDDLEMLGDEPGIAEMDVELGSLYAGQKAYHRAKTHYFFALNYFQSVHDDSTSMRLLTNIGDMQTALKRWRRAEWTLQQALYYAEKLSNQQHLVTIYYKLGLAQIQGGDYDKGLKSIKLARMLYDGEPLPGLQNEQMLNEIQNLLKERE